MGNEFDIDFSLLPPRLQMELWVLALDANTSNVSLAYREGSFQTSLKYNYGGNVEASMSVRRFTGTIGVDPGNGDVDLGVAFRGFRFGMAASVQQRTFGANLSYGAALLPFPEELAGTFNSAGQGLPSLAADIRRAPNNPLAWYRLHSNDVAAITRAVSAGKQLANQKTEPRFGAALRLNYTPQTGLVIYGGAQLRF